jgi:hypothetical protein
MVKNPAFLGFSMVRRSNRRRLVAITYAILPGLTVAAIIILPSLHHPLGGAGIAFGLWGLFMVVSWSIFGRLAKDTVLPQTRGGEMTSLGLTPRHHHGELDLDEREVAVRNAAYFTAYRAVAVCWFVVWIASLYALDLSAHTAGLLVSLLGLLLFEVIFTLPSAVILWREPDVPEEARA